MVFAFIGVLNWFKTGWNIFKTVLKDPPSGLKAKEEISNSAKTF